MIIPELTTEKGLYFREPDAKELELFKEVAEMGVDISMFESPESYQEHIKQVMDGLWPIINNNEFFIMSAREYGYTKRENEGMDNFKKRVKLEMIKERRRALTK